VVVGLTCGHQRRFRFDRPHYRDFTSAGFGLWFRNECGWKISCIPCCLCFRPRSSTSSVADFEAVPRSLRYSLVTRIHPSDGFVGRLQSLSFPPPCYPSYGAPTLTPVGAFSRLVCQPFLDARACSAFTHVMACTLAESPSDPLHRNSGSFVASAAVSIATGWSEPVPGRESRPLKSSAFHGALFHQLPHRSEVLTNFP
jgi:hypothetical protein